MVLKGSGWLWEASNSSRKLARSLRDVRNHAPTAGGKHTLLHRCFASPKRARWRKSQNRVVTIGDSTIFNIRQDAMGCYDGIWKCRNRLPTTGKETIFEYSAWQPMRVQKSTIFKNIHYFHWWEHDFLDMQNSDFQKSRISICGRAISEIAKTSIFTN